MYVTIGIILIILFPFVLWAMLTRQKPEESDLTKELRKQTKKAIEDTCNHLVEEILVDVQKAAQKGKSSLKIYYDYRKGISISSDHLILISAKLKERGLNASYKRPYDGYAYVGVWW